MRHDKAYLEAENKIQLALQSGATELDLSNMQLTELPESIGQLTQLTKLDLSDNQLTVLPSLLGQLTQLHNLILFMNNLTDLPDSLSELSELVELSISTNQFTSIPKCVFYLQKLKQFYLIHNSIELIPDQIGNLVELEVLELGGTKISSSAMYGNSEGYGNKIVSLPLSFLQLTKLRSLGLYGNPLNPTLGAAYEKGLDSVKRYLREMEKGAQKRYEAKLLILGDGNEGKTCVSRALRGLPFRKQNTTHGVDVVQWKFPHPDDTVDNEKDITLNIWDFEGQEISHQTHQFFLTSQSLYLLVFKCRDKFLMDRVEYWLDTVRARAPQAKVAIVISQCEGRYPHVPQDQIQAQYGDMLTKEWFFPVGCENRSNIPKLTAFLQRWAADMEFMGSPWPMSNAKAETSIKARAKRGTASITRDKLYAIFAKADMSEEGYDDAAARLSRLGVITQFPDCPDLRDFIVLRPQWLTKAISKVMEDKKLSEDKGEIALQRMEAMWKTDYPSMYATFHDCMKEFELCYDLEDGDRCCLVPLRFGYLRPEIPWTNRSDMKERRVEYKLNIRPPMGIMSRFIVKTHHMIVKTMAHPKGIYWHNGVFLFSGEGVWRSEALCEFLPEERKLRIEVRAAYPQNMCEQIHAYVKAVFSFFSGLETERSYGCIKVDEVSGAEEKCFGLHTERRIYAEMSMGQPKFVCEHGYHQVDPHILIYGFSSFGQFVKEQTLTVAKLRLELDKPPVWAEPYLNSIGTLLDWVDAHDDKMDQLLQGQSALSAEFKQEAELKLQQYLALTNELLDDRDYTAAPGLISIRTQDRSKWNPTSYFKQAYLLTPYCECPDNIHACEDGQVAFSKDRAWWAKSAPWIARGTKLLSVGLQLAFSGMPLSLGKEAFEAIKEDVDFMNKLAEKMELEQGDASVEADVVAEFGKEISEGDRESRLTRAALAHLLEELAPNNYRARQWGSLRRVRMPDNSHRWLCGDCAKHHR